MIFKDRQQAGQELGKRLLHLREQNPVVLAIPRGGVVVGYEVARTLGAGLDILVPRKIGAPYEPELAVGAVTEDGSLVLDNELLQSLGVREDYIEDETKRQIAEIERRNRLYRSGRQPVDLKGKAVIIVDDGLATGATMRAAIKYLKKKNPKGIVVAVPVAPPEIIQRLKGEVEEVICLSTPEPFYAIGQFYQSFDQVEDEEVITLLTKAQLRATQRSS